VRWFYPTIGGVIIELGGRVCGSITVLRISDYQLREDRDMAALIQSRFPNLARLHMMVYGYASRYTRTVVDVLREGEVEVLCEPADTITVSDHHIQNW